MHIFDEDAFKEFLFKHLLYVLLTPLIIGGLAGFLVSKQYVSSNCALALSAEPTEAGETVVKNIKIDLSGAVNKPGVYEVPGSSRVGDLLALGGGFTNETSAEWVSKNLNLSKILTDSAKIYIPFEWEVASDFKYELVSLINTAVLESTSDSVDTTTQASSDSINVNTASLSELDTLPGIGATYAQKIIDNRSYSDFAEFKANSKIPQSTADNIKELISF
jgi:competence protein ComEA